jgi:hypothetical protein
MFGEIEDIVDRALRLNESVAWFEVNDREVQWEIIRLNTIDQLFNEGILSDGSLLPEYSEASVNEYGKRDGHIQLKDTGEFYRSFVVKVDPRGMEIIANTKKGDSLKDDLASRYGLNILGLTDENENILAKLLTDKYIKYVEQKILFGD